MQRTKLRDFNPAYLAACRALECGLGANLDTSRLNVLMDEVVRQRDVTEARAAMVAENLARR